MNEQSRKLLSDYVAAKTPGDETQATAWAAINERIASGDMGPNLPEEVAPSTGSGLALKGLLVGLVGAAAIYGGVQLLEDPPPPVEPSTAVATPQPQPPPPAPESGERRAVAPEEPIEQLGEDAPDPPSAPVATPPARATKKKPAPKPAPEVEERPEASTLAAEMALLGRGQRALKRGDPKRALALFDQHAREYPRGELADERRVQRARALCDLGRRDDALAAVEAFRRRRPDSPLLGKASRICKDGDQ